MYYYGQKWRQEEDVTAEVILQVHQSETREQRGTGEMFGHT